MHRGSIDKLLLLSLLYHLFLLLKIWVIGGLLSETSKIIAGYLGRILGSQISVSTLTAHFIATEIDNDWDEDKNQHEVAPVGFLVKGAITILAGCVVVINRKVS